LLNFFLAKYTPASCYCQHESQLL